MEKQKPVHEVQYGYVKAAVWQNQTEHGVRHNVTVTRIYRKDEQWKTSDSFGRDDLLFAAKALNDAHTWICQQRQED